MKMKAQLPLSKLFQMENTRFTSSIFWDTQGIAAAGESQGCFPKSLEKGTPGKAGAGTARPLWRDPAGLEPGRSPGRSPVLHRSPPAAEPPRLPAPKNPSRGWTASRLFRSPSFSSNNGETGKPRHRRPGRLVTGMRCRDTCCINGCLMANGAYCQLLINYRSSVNSRTHPARILRPQLPPSGC